MEEFKIKPSDYEKILLMRMKNEIDVLMRGKNEFDACIIGTFQALIQQDLQSYSRENIIELMKKKEFNLVDIPRDLEHMGDVYLQGKKVGIIRRKISKTKGDDWTLEFKYEFKKCEENKEWN